MSKKETIKAEDLTPFFLELLKPSEFNTEKQKYEVQPIPVRTYFLYKKEKNIKPITEFESLLLKSGYKIDTITLKKA